MDTQPIKRRPPTVRKALPEPDRVKRSREKKRTSRETTWPDAHPNELRESPRYARNEDENLDLPDEGASYQGKPKVRPFRRGLQIRGLPPSSDGWSPEQYLEKPADCGKSFKAFCETWASEQDAGPLVEWQADCVWGWCPGGAPPDWWRIKLHPDDTYMVLCLCFVYNFRCYQPGLGQDFDEFLRVALKRDSAADALKAVSDKLRTLCEKDWNKKNDRPEECAWPDCGKPLAQLESHEIHFCHQALTRFGLGYYCRPCNIVGQALFDAWGPKKAGEIIEKAVLHTSFKGVFITMPLAPES